MPYKVVQQSVYIQERRLFFSSSLFGIEEEEGRGDAAPQQEARENHLWFFRKMLQHLPVSYYSISLVYWGARLSDRATGRWLAR